MRVLSPPGSRYTEIAPETSADLNILRSFVGGSKSRSRHSKLINNQNPRVVKSVLRRLKAHVDDRVNVRLDKATTDIYRSEEHLRPLPDWFRYHTDPLAHQDIALRYLWTYRRYGLGLDPGLGKTKVVLDWFHLMQVQKALVVCPKPLLFVWLQQARQHRPELKLHVMSGVSYSALIAVRTAKMAEETDPAKLRLLAREIRNLEEDRAAELAAFRAANVILVNYAKLLQNEKFFFKTPWDALAVDEALVKNPESEQSRIIQTISDSDCPVTLMSGTLINNHAGDCFSPTRILDRTALGSSFYEFQQRYAIFRALLDEKGDEKGKMLVAYKDEEDIRDALNSVFLFMRKEQWLKDLPPKVFHEIEVDLSGDQKRIYKLLKDNYTVRLPNEEWVEVDNPMVMASKLSQISSGFLYYGNAPEETREIGLTSLSTLLKTRKKGAKPVKKPKSPRYTFLFRENPKLDKTVELLTGPLSREKVVLWYNYGAEGDLLATAMTDLGIPFRVINGDTKKPGDAITEFNETENVRVLLCQAKAVNYGVTLLGRDLDDCEYEPDLSPQVSTHIFYSLNYSLEVFLQQQDRSHRIGMTKSPHYYILRGKTLIERAIARRLLAKMEVRETFLEDTLKPPTKKSASAEVDGLGD